MIGFVNVSIPSTITARVAYALHAEAAELAAKQAAVEIEMEECPSIFTDPAGHEASMIGEAIDLIRASREVRGLGMIVTDEECRSIWRGMVERIRFDDDQHRNQRRADRARHQQT